MVSTAEIDSSHKEYSDQWLIANYLKYGSVEAVFSAYSWQIPFSVPEYHRRVKKAGIVKGDGRSNKSIASALYIFLQRALAPDLSLEKIYRSMPIKLRDARLSSIYRIYDSILRGKTRRLAVGAVISPEYDPRQVLVADETMTQISSAKTQGQATIPFGFASRRQSFDNTVLRVLQREFSSDLALSGDLVIGGELSNRLIPKDSKPFLELQILDVRVLAANIILPEEFCDLSCCTSFTVKNHRFVRLEQLLDGSINLRTGMGEIFQVYKNLLEDSAFEPRFELSALNKALLPNF